MERPAREGQVTHRSLLLWNCHLLCHLFRCTTSLPSAPSPAPRLPPHLLCHVPLPLLLMGSTSFLCLPRHTKDRCQLTITALAGVQYLQDLLRLSRQDSLLKEARANYDLCEPLLLHPSSTPADSRRRATRRRRWRSRWCDRQTNWQPVIGAQTEMKTDERQMYPTGLGTEVKLNKVMWSKLNWTTLTPPPAPISWTPGSSVSSPFELRRRRAERGDKGRLSDVIISVLAS